MKHQFTKFFILFVIFLTGCNVDLGTKRLAMRTIKDCRTVTVVDGYLELSYTENQGVVFGLLNNQRSDLKHYLLTGLTSLTILLIISIIWYFRRLSFVYHLPFFLILAGAFGNLIDRIRFGHVVDFIHIHWKNNIDWPFLFNVADILICCGELLLIILVLLKSDDLFQKIKNSQKNVVLS